MTSAADDPTAPLEEIALPGDSEVRELYIKVCATIRKSVYNKHELGYQLALLPSSQLARSLDGLTVVNNDIASARRRHRLLHRYALTSMLRFLCPCFEIASLDDTITEAELEKEIIEYLVLPQKLGLTKGQEIYRNDFLRVAEVVPLDVGALMAAADRWALIPTFRPAVLERRSNLQSSLFFTYTIQVEESSVTLRAKTGEEYTATPLGGGDEAFFTHGWFACLLTLDESAKPKALWILTSEGDVFATTLKKYFRATGVAPLLQVPLLGRS